MCEANKDTPYSFPKFFIRVTCKIFVDEDTVKIPTIHLKWSKWHKWNVLKLDSRRDPNRGVRIPNKQPGVYEAVYEGEEKRLTVGKASDLRMRIKQGLIKGKVPHSTGERMKSENLDFSKIVVRGAVTDRPSAVEEELHKRHVEKYGELPKYVKRT